MPQTIDLSVWVAGITKRIEAQIRGDRTPIPGLRKLRFRFSAITSHLMSRTFTHKGETVNEFADRLVAAAQKLSRLLTEGV